MLYLIIQGEREAFYILLITSKTRTVSEPIVSMQQFQERAFESFEGIAARYQMGDSHD
jgi:hypothetical protein